MTHAAPSLPNVRPAISDNEIATGECPRPCTNLYSSRSRIKLTLTSANNNASHTSNPQHPKSTTLDGPIPAGDTVSGSAKTPAPTVLPVIKAIAPSTEPVFFGAKHRCSYFNGSGGVEFLFACIDKLGVFAKTLLRSRKSSASWLKKSPSSVWSEEVSGMLFRDVSLPPASSYRFAVALTRRGGCAQGWVAGGGTRAPSCGPRVVVVQL